jgi:cell division protein FtsQ
MYAKLAEKLRFLFSSARWLALLVLLIALIVLAGVFRSPHYFPVRAVKVTGYFPAEAETLIQSIVQANASKGFFAANIQTIQKKLASLPWVKEASVTRAWPDKFTVTVDQEKPTAIWNNSGLVLEDGSVFTPTIGQLPNNLPYFTGKQPDIKKIVDKYKKMNDILKSIGLNITHVSLLSDSGWQITLSNLTIVLLGEPDELIRLRRFVSIYPETFGNKKKSPYLVDMRYSHGMAVKWKKTE